MADKKFAVVLSYHSKKPQKVTYNVDIHKAVFTYMYTTKAEIMRNERLQEKFIKIYKEVDSLKVGQGIQTLVPGHSVAVIRMPK